MNTRLRHRGRFTEPATAEMAFGTGRAELKSLTSLRGLAALAVVLQHFSATAQGYCRTTIPSLVPHGYVGVDFFFVLSGFIMAYTYAPDFHLRGMGAYGPFLAKRVARIVPLNLAVLCAIALAGSIGVLFTGRAVLFQTSRPIFDFFCNMLMLQGFGIGTNLNGPSWSISTECAAYALFPLFAAMILRGRVGAASAAAASVAALCASAAGNQHWSMAVEAFPGSLVRCFAEFILGMWAYRLSSNQPVASVLRQDIATAGLAGAAAAFLIARLDLPAVLLLPFVVIAFAVNDGAMARLLQWRAFHFLGAVSYSLYLLHNPFRPIALSILRAVTSGPVNPLAAQCFVVIAALSVVPFAWMAYATVEQPGRRMVRGLFARLGEQQIAIRRVPSAPPGPKPS